MNLNKVRNDISKLKKEIIISDDPSIQDFHKFCERVYKRPVNIGEILYRDYKRYNIKKDMVTCESNLKLYCQLSVKYFEEIHQDKIGNPIKEGESYSLKNWLVNIWQEQVNRDADVLKLKSNQVLECKDFNDWYNSYWNFLINSGTNPDESADLFDTLQEFGIINDMELNIKSDGNMNGIYNESD